VSKGTPPIKIRLTSKDGVKVVEVEGPSSEAPALVDLAIQLWRFLVRL
jgi:hypothetical protein